jgi:formylglycine-generating enzyme required for sulfatase activity
MKQFMSISVLALALLSVVSTDKACGQPESHFPALSQEQFVRADGATKDKKTGLPTRIVHKASGIVLVLIPAGEFMMGSPEGELERSKGDHERLHRRIISKPFYMGETEVTVGQFRRFVQAAGYQTDAERGIADNDRQSKGAFATVPLGDREWHTGANWQNPFPNLKDYKFQENHPVVQISWNDAQQFCAHFSLRLPTEAQWEYASRAGSQTRFPWGDGEAGGKGFANVADVSTRKRFPVTNVFFPFDDGAPLLSPVGHYKPNAWMLYDLIGNVEEWCEDAYQKYPADGADESAAQGDTSAVRILRGGSWLSNSTTGRAATRIGMRPSSRRDFQGFRVVATVENVR